MSKRSPYAIPTHNLVYGREEFTGFSKKEVEATRDDVLNRLFADDLTPVVITHPGVSAAHLVVCVVFPTASGFWSYFIRGAHVVEVTDLSVRPLVHGAYDKRAAVRAARRHLAQWCYAPLGPSTADCLATDDDEGRREHLSWERFQDAYRRARNAGMDENTALATAQEIS